jgi:hypothetical protein
MHTTAITSSRTPRVVSPSLIIALMPIPAITLAMSSQAANPTTQPLSFVPLSK